MKPVDIPQANVPLTNANGVLTLQGHLMLVRMAEAIKDLQERVEALEP